MIEFIMLVIALVMCIIAIIFAIPKGIERYLDTKNFTKR